MNRDVFLFSSGMGLIPTALAYVLYTKGLSGVEAGRAAILANLEPLVALLAGLVFFGDTLTTFQALGALSILGSVIIVQK